MQDRRLNRWLLTRLAAQNVLRRKLRVALLALSVSLAVGVGLASIVLGFAIRASIASNFSRMGADLVVVPQNTLVNLTGSLLTVQPTETTLDQSAGSRLSEIPGITRMAAQRLMPLAVEGNRVNVVAFDPNTDFTVRNWLQQPVQGTLKSSDILVGSDLPGQKGEALSVCGRSMSVAGRLRKTGVGPFDGSYFVTFAALDQLAEKADSPHAVRPVLSAALHEHAGHSMMGHDTMASTTPACMADYHPSQVTAFLLQLSPDARVEQVKFAISRNPTWKVVEGNSVLISSRQDLHVLFVGVVIFILVLLMALLVLVGLLFSGIVQERYREMGLLRAMGARSRQVMTMILAEAAMTTTLGGIGGLVLGAALLFFFARSLIYYFDCLAVSFAWPSLSFVVATSLGLLILSAGLGLVGAVLPAWTARRIDPFALIHSGGK